MPLTAVAHRFPVSVKGVILTPAREVEEELGVRVRAASLLDCWLYEVRPGAEVLIVTYGCHAEPFTSLTHSAEHAAAGAFAPAALRALAMPDGYRRSIRDWLARMGGEP